MATITRSEPGGGIDTNSVDSQDATVLVAGVPQGRLVRDPGWIAYEEAYEIVGGRIQQRPEMSAYSVELASILHLYLGTYVRQQVLGRSIVEARFQTRPDQQRRPNVAFISFDRWPQERRAPRGAVWDLSPDLAVEVTSPSDTAWDVLAKVREYFDGDVRAVWLIYPNLEVVHIYSSWSAVEVVTREQTLDGGAVVPGFRLPLADLFEGEAAPEETSEPELTT